MTAAHMIAQEIWDHELKAVDPTIDWIWDGFVACGDLTLLTGMWKTGKTTLLTLLLSSRKSGGTLAGQKVKPGKTVVVTEERDAKWAERVRLHDFGGQVLFFPRPFRHVPTAEEWQALLDRILERNASHGIDLVVLDPLAPLLRNESSPRCMLDTLLPLGTLRQRGVGVLAMHHPAKGQPAIGQAARGTGALPGHVNISIEMRQPGGDPLTRRRRLLSMSHHAQTPRQLLIELNLEGTEYRAVAEEDDFDANWSVLTMIFEDAPQKLTRADVLEEWPADFPKPAATSLWRWLDRAVRLNMLSREGTGRKNDPFRYWFPATVETWRKRNPTYDLVEELRVEQNLPYQSLTEKRRLDRQADNFREEEDDGERQTESLK
jgi:hypothetical protein